MFRFQEYFFTIHFYVYECLASMYIHAQCVYLVSVETEESIVLLRMKLYKTMSRNVGTGN